MKRQEVTSVILPLILETDRIKLQSVDNERGTFAHPFRGLFKRLRPDVVTGNRGDQRDICKSSRLPTQDGLYNRTKVIDNPRQRPTPSFTT